MVKKLFKMHQGKAVSSQRFQAVPQSVLHCATAPPTLSQLCSRPRRTSLHRPSPTLPSWVPAMEVKGWDQKTEGGGDWGSCACPPLKATAPRGPLHRASSAPSSLENYGAPLGLSPRAPHPRVSPQPCSLFICTITLHDISFPLGPCLMQPAGPSRLIQKQYIVSINLI